MSDKNMHTYCKPAVKTHNSSDADMNEENELAYCICRSSDTSRFMIGCDSCNEWYHGDCISITEEYAKNIKHFFCLMCRERDSSHKIQFKSDSPDKKKNVEKSEMDTKKSNVEHDDHQAKKSSRRCGECTACYRNEDCGRCDFCKDMRKFGGANKIHQKCRQRQCMNFGLILGRKPKHIPGSQSDDTEDNEQMVDPITLSNDFLNVLKVSDDDDEDNDRDADYQPQGFASKSGHKSRSNRQSGRHRGRRTEHRKKNSEKENSSSKKEDMLRQCYGPGCVRPARSNSKYCSDECGLKLATNRIYEILPHRIQQWQAFQSVADESNRRSLEKVRREQQEAKDSLSQLNKRQDALEDLVQTAKKTLIAVDQESLDGELEESEISMYCVTCGYEIGAKYVLKHMEKCFNKYESQTSFGSFYQTNMEVSNIFCDYHNSQQRTYCKRLKILCPEHSKEPKISDDEVCGCPLIKGVFEESGKFCCVLKKKCGRHHQWEKFRRAEIDLDKMRLLFKLDDLMEQERNVRQQMANRGGVLGLMLHQTICHKEESQNSHV